MQNRKLLASAVLSLSLATVVRGQATTPPPAVTPDQLQELPISAGAATRASTPTTDVSEARAKLLGERFESKMSGVAFHVPADFKVFEKVGRESNLLCEYQKDSNSLRVTKMTTGTAMDLSGHNDKDGSFKPGLLDFTVEQIKTATADAKVLRQEVINVGEYDAGVIAYRFSLGTKSFLRQQAFVQADKKFFFVFNYTTDSNPAGDPAADKLAVDTFDAVINSLEILDMRPMVEDQKLRLYRTRALFVRWTPAVLQAALIRQQWLRILKDGKDVGYSAVAEESNRPEHDGFRSSVDGILISIRSRTMLAKDQQVDIGSQYYVSLDRRHEDWEQVITTRKGPSDDPSKQVKQMGSVFGTTDIKQTSRLTDPLNAADKKQAINGERITVEVNHMGDRGDAEPVSREAAPWYTSQALIHLLPRLVPLDQPKGYLFQTYVAEQRELMHRYVDVGVVADVTLAGKSVVAIPISDRIGIEGKPTIHYMSPDGKYLGTVIPAEGIVVVPSDEATLRSIWKDADFTRPASVNRGPSTAPSAR